MNEIIWSAIGFFLIATGIVGMLRLIRGPRRGHPPRVAQPRAAAGPSAAVVSLMRDTQRQTSRKRSPERPGRAAVFLP